MAKFDLTSRKTDIWVSSYSDYDNAICGTSADTHQIGELLDLADDARDWDEFVLEDEFTVRDVIYSIAEYCDLNPDEYEELDELQDAIESFLDDPEADWDSVADDLYDRGCRSIDFDSIEELGYSRRNSWRIWSALRSIERSRSEDDYEKDALVEVNGVLSEDEEGYLKDFMEITAMRFFYNYLDTPFLRGQIDHDIKRLHAWEVAPARRVRLRNAARHMWKKGFKDRRSWAIRKAAWIVGYFYDGAYLDSADLAERDGASLWCPYNN